MRGVINMLEFDEEKAIALIKKETKYEDELAKAVMNKLKGFREELQPYLNAWINGEKPNFEFHGISIEEIVQKLDKPYILAFGSMNIVLKNPEKFVNAYRTIDFRLR
jgi:hypothetical protein